ncbi:MAG: hypothetical protein Q8R82_12130, partial [Hyphomonadaceae bacterium]|nr:hypothetical protein [Hyphomonadaceae bacterium]
GVALRICSKTCGWLTMSWSSMVSPCVAWVCDVWTLPGRSRLGYRKAMELPDRGVNGQRRGAKCSAGINQIR